MPPKCPPAKTPHERRQARQEAVLLGETAQFMRIAAHMLQAILIPASMVRRRLARTGAFKRVDGLDSAQDEPVWDAAGTLETNLERDIHEMAGYLRAAAREAEQAARRRA